jgi:hypothetical protein
MPVGISDGSARSAHKGGNDVAGRQNGQLGVAAPGLSGGAAASIAIEHCRFTATAMVERSPSASLPPLASFAFDLIDLSLFASVAGSSRLL